MFSLGRKGLIWREEKRSQNNYPDTQRQLKSVLLTLPKTLVLMSNLNAKNVMHFLKLITIVSGKLWRAIKKKLLSSYSILCSHIPKSIFEGAKENNW